MVTDEMMDAIDKLIEICSDEEQAKGMKSVREMLADFKRRKLWIFITVLML